MCVRPTGNRIRFLRARVRAKLCVRARRRASGRWAARAKLFSAAPVPSPVPSRPVPSRCDFVVVSCRYFGAINVAMSLWFRRAFVVASMTCRCDFVVVVS